MTQQANVFQEGVDRVREALGSIEGEVQRVQKDVRKELQARRKALEKRINANRSDLEKRTKKFRTEIQKNATVKRLDTLRRDASRQIEDGVESVLGALQIASKGDVQRIDRKLNQLNRKLKDVERSRQAKRSSGKATETAA